MASKEMQISLVLVVMAMAFVTVAMAQSDCSNVILSMASCLNYVTGSSTTPSSSCCFSLANVVKTQPRCLCSVLKGGGSMGASINTTLALALPGACKVQTPPVSKCDESSAEGFPPVGAPTVTVSKTSPESGSASITKMHLQLVAFLVFAATSYASSSFISF